MLCKERTESEQRAARTREAVEELNGCSPKGKPEPEFRKWEVDFPKCQLELAKMIS